MSKIQRRTYPDITSYMEGTGTTQAQVAAILGRSQPFISKIRRGLTQPSLSEALRISRVLGVPVESLVSHTRNIPASKP
jgi:transcriptional regulator with XRE-family HTH domain